MVHHFTWGDINKNSDNVGPAKALLKLKEFLLGPEHRQRRASEGPIETVAFIILILFLQMNRVFEALAMLEKLLNLAHLSEAVKNLIF